MIHVTQLDENQEDHIKWKFTASGEYTEASAYKAQFLGNVKVPKAQTIWRAWAPPKCKFFVWLVTHDRVWTSDRLMRRGCPHSPSCPLCRNAPETALHLLAECRYTKRVWNLIAEWLAQPTLRPEVGDKSIIRYTGGLTSPPAITCPAKGSDLFLSLLPGRFGVNEMLEFSESERRQLQVY